MKLVFSLVVNHHQIQNRRNAYETSAGLVSTIIITMLSFLEIKHITRLCRL